MMVLQTSPLPLGYHTIKNVLVIYQNQGDVSTRALPKYPEWAEKKDAPDKNPKRLYKENLFKNPEIIP